jgi:tetratricopeptide (TPR) repeat protein
MNQHAPKKLFKEVFAIVNNAMINFRYSTAARKLERILQKYPLEEQWWCYIGMLYDHLALRQRTQHPRQYYQRLAVRACHQALKLKPDSACAYEGLGRVYWHNGNKRAIYYYNKAYRITKRRSRSLNYNVMNLANVYFKLKKYKCAEKLYLRYAEQWPHFGVFHALTELYIRTKHPLKANYYLKRAKKALARDQKFYPTQSKALHLAKESLRKFEEELGKFKYPDRP